MAGFEKAKVIDGFSSIQAVRRKSGDGSDGPRLRESSSKLPERHPGENEGQDTAPNKVRIGHTALPPKFEIVCYECSYEFTVTGRLHNVICPKCREQLEVGDYVVDGERTGAIKTIGSVTVKDGGALRGASVIAGDLILEGGTVEDSQVRACGCVQLGEGAYYRGASINTRDVLIRAGACVAFRGSLMCRQLDVEGDVKGRLSCEGAMTVHPGGVIRGEVVTEHLIVHDGGGLKAKVRVGQRKPTKTKTAGKRRAGETWELPPLSAAGRKRRAPRKPRPKPPPAASTEAKQNDSVIKEDSDGQETRIG